MNLPNKITVVRIFLTAVFVVLALVPMEHGLLYSAGVFVIASVSDFLDGYLARSRNLVTNLGKFLDPLADKMLVMSALLVLVSYDMFPVWAAIVILCRDLAVDGLRFVAAQQGTVIAASKWGKRKTTVQMIMVVMLLVAEIIPFDWYGILCQVMIWLSVLLTVVSGADYLYKGKDLIK